MLDLLIKNGIIVDGTKKPRFQGDVAIKDGKIVEVAPKIDLNAEKVIDASGKIVAPGFIDLHRHADAAVFKEEFGEIELRQGITTLFSGNCGFSLTPCPVAKRDLLSSYIKPIIGQVPPERQLASYGAYAKALSSLDLPCNFGYFAGNGTIRIAVKGFSPDCFSAKEIKQAENQIEAALDSGAFGLSLGLMYSPENYYRTDELIQLCSVLKKYDGILVTHIRGEGNSLLNSISEVLQIAEKSEIPIEISHLKAAGKNNWGKGIEAALKTISAAREKGIDATCDVYPYDAGSTTLLSLLPPSYLAGGVQKTLTMLQNKRVREQLKKELHSEQTTWDNLLFSLGWSSVVISSVTTQKNQEYVGKSIAEIAKIQNKDEVDCLADLIVAEAGNVSIIIFSMSVDDVKTVIAWEHSLIISDSIYSGNGLPHPRLYGSFPRVISKYVREEKTLSLEDAIYKMTGKPAQRMKLENKGIICPNCDADLIVFDYDKIDDVATYLEPQKPAVGFDYVLLAGNVVVENDQFLQIKKGRHIKR